MAVTAENSRFAGKKLDLAKAGGVACLGANYVTFFMDRSNSVLSYSFNYG
jgi:hypothetical protein